MDFDKLLNDVLENPEILLDTNSISNEQIIELQKRMNPYSKLVGNYDPINKQIAVCSYTNLREEYLRRFTMTSLVSYVFQMLHEYEVPKEDRTWIPKGSESDPFIITDLKDQLQGIVTILDEANEADKLERKLQTKLLLDKTVDPKQIYDAQQKKAGLIFTSTYMLKELGLTASAKLKAATIDALKFPEVKEIIKTKKYNTAEFSEHEFPQDKSKEIINSFLKKWFVFDPSVHIRSGINKENIKTEVINIQGNDVVIDTDDPSHLTLEELTHTIEPKLDTEESKKDLEILSLIKSNKFSLKAVQNIIRDENMHDAIKYAIDNIDRFKHYLFSVKNVNVPPQDTFHRWNYFTEVNYEEIRTVTETLYPDKPDLDWAIAIWTTFKGTDEELEEQFTDYCQIHSDEMPSVMKALEIGKWSLLADFKENRKNIQFYNKHTEVLKKIIDRHTEDKKIGSELMRNRVRQTKAKNIAEQGPDAPGLKAYKTTISGDGKDLMSKGVERVITPEEMKRLERAQGNIKAAKELEVLEEYEKIVKGFEDIMNYRELSKEEADKRERAKEYLIRAKEMINVPEDAIQVDVFTTDTKTGAFSKSHFYTKCDEALEKES